VLLLPAAVLGAVVLERELPAFQSSSLHADLETFVSARDFDG
jgi:hypothetical protein